MKDLESAQHEDIDDDIELAGIVIGYLEAATQTLNAKKMDALLDDWAMGHIEVEPTEEQAQAMMGLAIDACLFAPSLSGATPMSRFLASVRTDDFLEKQALKAMARSEIRSVRILRRLGPDLVELQDRFSDERFVLVDNEFAEDSEGSAALLRLCRFDSGRYVLINYPFLLTESLRDIVMSYFRPGKGIGNPYRCACAVYKHAVREGIIAIPHRDYTDEERAEIDAVKLAAAAADLDSEWNLAKNDPEVHAELVAELREVASIESVISYLQLYSLAVDEMVPVSPENLREICALLVKELVHKQRLAAIDADDEVERLKQAVSDLVETGELHRESALLLNEILGSSQQNLQ